MFIDDIIVYAKTFAAHVERLGRVFDRLHAARFKLKPIKCKLFQRRVVFWGHVISEKGVEPDPSKISAVVDWPTPRNVAEVRGFVGLAGYYRSFVEHFSAIAAPLFDLTKKGAAFVWDEPCQNAFDILKQRLTTTPILASPRDGGGYVLDVDTSAGARPTLLLE